MIGCKTGVYMNVVGGKNFEVNMLDKVCFTFFLIAALPLMSTRLLVPPPFILPTDTGP